MAPFLAYLSSEEANYIIGVVFSVTADARVTLYTDLKPGLEIKKDIGPWTMDELVKVVPEQLLKEYVSITVKNDFR